MIDLKEASRDALIRHILTQRETIQRQERIIADLHAEVAQLSTQVATLSAQVGALLAERAARERDDGGRGGGPRGMPGLKPPDARLPAPQRERKRREQAFVRQRMEPSARVFHAVDRCPRCGTPLSGGSVKRTREVIEVPVVAAVVTEHVYLERRCPCCQTRHTPTVALAGVVDGQQRFGVGLVSLIVTLREEGRLPVGAIRWYLATFHRLEVSVGAITAAIQRVAGRGQAAAVAIREEIRGSPVAHADETGWREGGVNGYVWTFCTPTARYFTRGNRSAAMVAAALGEEFAGVLVSDFYAGYAPHDGVKQKCWAHLLRDVHDLRVAHAKDATVQAWAAGVQEVYARAVAWKATHPEADNAVRRAASDRCMAALQAVYAPSIGVATVPQRVLSERMAKHLHELFVFVVEPDVSPDNNRAERSLRHLVTSRKISGGTRSAAGSAAKMTLATLFGTWRLRGENPYHACRALLTSPQP